MTITLQAARTANAAYAPVSRPVALFFGGTSGIGHATAAAFARYTKGDAHIIIVGRNRLAAESIIAEFPKAPTSKYEFVECDGTLMKNVQHTTTSLLASLPKLNYLFATAGYLTLKGRDETDEGLDRKLALNYYARWKFTNDLMPLLRKSKDAGEDAKVMSVLAAGNGGPIDLEDLGLKKGYTLRSAGIAAATCNDLMIESLAEQHPDMAFTHMSPGIVRTPMAMPTSSWLKPLYPLVLGLLYPISVSMSESAEYMLHALFSGENGAFRRGAKGELLKNSGAGYFSSDEAKRRVWAHTKEVTTVI
ncbi:NAD(P)-binding protein [Athelia psychrophila]|uniref:NAD(P)-binding protein n=1 Tax=Athelia psychrophila TaxID=1759441 RepID=A0A166EGY0_9AGAM|nr:NAD(P)-binding protein [Fibularhizoctonia sp. CBS 109695]